MELARRVAAATGTRVDDELLDLLEALRDEPALRRWIGRKLQQSPGALAVEAAPAAPIAAALADRNLDWEKLLSYLPRILEILRLVKALGNF